MSVDPMIDIRSFNENAGHTAKAITDALDGWTDQPELRDSLLCGILLGNRIDRHWGIDMYESLPITKRLVIQARAAEFTARLLEMVDEYEADVRLIIGPDIRKEVIDGES